MPGVWIVECVFYMLNCRFVMSFGNLFYCHQSNICKQIYFVFENIENKNVYRVVIYKLRVDHVFCSVCNKHSD